MPADQAQTIPVNRFPTDAPARVQVAANRRLTPAGADEVRLITLDLSPAGSFPYREGQAVAVEIPGWPDKGHGSAWRYYSIASGRGGDDAGSKTLSLCVKRVRRFDPESGIELPSATSHLCDAAPGDELNLAGPFGQTFLLPDDPASNLILVATGTGVSPFRAFLRHLYRERTDWTGQIWLFSGAKSSAEALFRDELDALAGEQPSFHYHPTLSLEEQAADGGHLHVHHRMAQHGEALWALLDDPRTYLYLCGVKGMVEPVEHLLDLWSHRDGISARAFHRMLQDTNRLRVEVY
jgi:ferredoxin--NADP+ reductase